MKKLMFTALLLLLAMLLFSPLLFACADCSGDSCVAVNAGGCACKGPPGCKRCGVCFTEKCHIACSPNSPTLTASEKRTRSALLDLQVRQSRAKSSVDLAEAWKFWLPNEEKLFSSVDAFSHVLGSLVKVEAYWLKNGGCEPLSDAAGGFSTRDAFHPANGDPAASWHATIDAATRTVTYDITKQPDNSLPSRLVITPLGWSIYKADATGFEKVASGLF